MSVLAECLHSEGDTPPMKGICVKCGRLLPPAPERDRQFEDETLELVAELCERVHSVSPRSFSRAVLSRLDKGQLDYGGTWVARPERDLLTEALDEPCDGSGWLLLYLQRLKDTLTHDQWLECRMIALDAMAYCAAADDALRRLGQLADELGRP